MTKKCLLFDNDGTLVDSEYLCNLGIAEQFALQGVTLDVDYLVKHYRGGKMSEVLDDIATKNKVVLPDSFLPEYRKRVAKLFDQQLKPIDGIAAALEQLPQQKAVVSNGPRVKIEHALSLCELSAYFGENIYSAYDVGAYKPDPEIYLFVANDLGYQPSDCVVIEDSIAGVTAGSRAGITTLFYNTHNETVLLPNVISFNQMSELPRIIKDLCTA